MTYDPSRTYCTGERPVNPIIFDKAVIFISDIQDEGVDEVTGAQKWSYIQDSIKPMSEYMPILKAEAVTESYENTIELIEELRPEK